MNHTMIGGLPLGVLLSSLLGAVLIAFGVLAAFAGMDLVPAELRLPYHPWSMLVAGFVADLPLIAYFLRKAAAAQAKR